MGRFIPRVEQQAGRGEQVVLVVVGTQGDAGEQKRQKKEQEDWLAEKHLGRRMLAFGCVKIQFASRPALELCPRIR